MHITVVDGGEGGGKVREQRYIVKGRGMATGWRYVVTE
jgi:hypothetical protein